ncbi:hypothetical protein H5410_014161 [Solanum commersonii]|uniref:Uncharacterized protein n=1 Tax=Solanum commersonii TaxID=4109 RepID=A0A9J5ZQ61_SOLCO|nr:hypothetical protein H5410_014161 [Solanum commersonii]
MFLMGLRNSVKHYFGGEVHTEAQESRESTITFLHIRNYQQRKNKYFIWTNNKSQACESREFKILNTINMFKTQHSSNTKGHKHG